MQLTPIVKLSLAITFVNLIGCATAYYNNQRLIDLTNQYLRVTPAYTGPRVDQDLAPTQWKGKHLDEAHLQNVLDSLRKSASGRWRSDADLSRMALFLVSESYRLGYESCAGPTPGDAHVAVH